MYKMYRVKKSLDIVNNWNLPDFVVGETWNVIICDFLWFYASKPVEKISNSIAANLAYLAVTEKTCFEIWVTLDKSETHPNGQVIARLISRENAEKRIAEFEAKGGYGNIKGIQVGWKDWRREKWKKKIIDLSRITSFQWTNTLVF